MRGVARTALGALLCAGVCSAELVKSLSGAIKGVGEGRVATVACCGVSKHGVAPIVSTALKRCEVELVPGATVLALVSAAEVAEGAVAVASSDVVLLELRQSDLEADGPHGLAQLAPLLQRSLTLYALKPQKKLLMLVVVVDDEPAPKEELQALAAAALGRVWVGLRKPEELEGVPLKDVFQLALEVVPAGAGEGAAVAALQARFRDADRPDYLFKEGEWSTQGSAALATVASLGAVGRLPLLASAAAGEVHAAYKASQLAERAAKVFSKGLAVLRKASEATALSDFGERIGALIDDALAQFDSEAEALQGAPPVAAARAALASMLARGAMPTCRRQLALLQLSTRDKFMQQLASTKPSMEVEKELHSMVKESTRAFEASAKAALPSLVACSFAFEKAAVRNSMSEAARQQIDLWRIQGLYLPMTGFKTPVDIGMHWLLPKPFGLDSRYDAVSSRDKPKFRPKAAAMKIRAMDGYKVHGLKDPKAMVFDSKMPA